MRVCMLYLTVPKPIPLNTMPALLLFQWKFHLNTRGTKITGNREVIFMRFFQINLGSIEFKMKFSCKLMNYVCRMGGGAILLKIVSLFLSVAMHHVPN